MAFKDMFQAIKDEMLAPNKDAARSLPDNKGSETPKQLKTYNTAPSSMVLRAGQAHQIYNAENWVKVVVVQESPALAAIGTNKAILPVTSAKGFPLQQGVPFEAVLPRATLLFVACESDSRISLLVQPIPWMEQVSNELRAVGRGIVSGLEALLHGMALLARNKKD